MKPEILLAIKQLTSEKALNEDVVFEAVERGMAAAVKRGYELPGHVVVQMDRIDGGLEVWSEREVVEIEEDIEDGDLQIELVRAREIDPNMRVSSVLRLKHDVGDVGVGLRRRRRSRWCCRRCVRRSVRRCLRSIRVRRVGLCRGWCSGLSRIR